MESTVGYLERSATADAWTGPRHRSRVFPKIGRKTETWSETKHGDTDGTGREQGVEKLWKSANGVNRFPEDDD